MDSDKKATSAREEKYVYTLHMEVSMLGSHSHNGHMYTVDMCTVEYYASSSPKHDKMSPFTHLQMHWHKKQIHSYNEVCEREVCRLRRKCFL